MAFYFWSMVFAISLMQEVRKKDLSSIPAAFASIVAVSMTGIRLSWVWQSLAFLIILFVGILMVKRRR